MVEIDTPAPSNTKRIQLVLGMCFTLFGFFLTPTAVYTILFAATYPQSSPPLFSALVDNLLTNFNQAAASVVRLGMDVLLGAAVIGTIGGLLTGWIGFRLSSAVLPEQWIPVSLRQAEGARRLGQVLGIAIGAPIGLLVYWWFADSWYGLRIADLMIAPIAGAAGIVIVNAIVHAVFWVSDSFKENSQ